MSATRLDIQSTTVNAFSEYARPAPLHLQSVDLNQLVRDVVELYKGRANPVRYDLELDATLPALHADSGRLRQVLHNLCENGLRYSLRATGAATLLLRPARQWDARRDPQYTPVRIRRVRLM